MWRKACVAGVAALVMVSLVACSSESKSGEGGGNQVGVTLRDYAIDPSATTVAAGKVTFKVENTGATEHEMVVIKTDLDPSEVPVEDHEANEEAPGMTPIGEVENVQPGQTTNLTLTLQPGSYLLICNIKKHFERGMVTQFQVS